jgi:outer membrane protein
MTRSLVVLIAASASIAAAPHALAQVAAAEAGPVRLTLAEAVERARSNSPRLEQLRALQQAADAGVRGARAGRLPVLDLQASYAHHSRVPELIVDFPGTPPQRIFPNLQDRFTTFAGLSLPLYTGGRVGGEIDAAQHEALASGTDVAAGLGDLVLETVTAYWDLVSARENERVLAESIAAYEADLKQVTDRVEVGMAARNDVLSVQVERDEAELSRLRAANNAGVANENLVRLLGLAPGSRVEPTEPMTATLASDEPVDALVAKAMEGRPEIAGPRPRRRSGSPDPPAFPRPAWRPASTTRGRTSASCPSPTPGTTAGGSASTSRCGRSTGAAPRRRWHRRAPRPTRRCASSTTSSGVSAWT